MSTSGTVTSPATQDGDLLAALAGMSTIPFKTVAEMVTASLQLVMQYLDVRSAFVAQLTDDQMIVLDSRDEAGCAIPRDEIVPVEETFCQYVRASGQPMVVPDASRDVRVQNVATRRDFNIGAYAGVPLRMSDGSIYGTLCALDPEPKQFTESQLNLMRVIGRQIAFMIEREQMLRQTLDEFRVTESDLTASLTMLEQQKQVLRVVAHDLRTPLGGILGYTELLRAGVFGPVVADQQDPLEWIANAGNLAQRLVNDITLSSAIELAVI